jgi:outer membrane receptor protein involved in Fe transport
MAENAQIAAISPFSILGLGDLMTHLRRVTIGYAVGAGYLMLNNIALAADSAPVAAAPSSDQLQEIVVTAQKRSEALNTVPISLTALDEDTMDKQGVRDIADIARLVPGLTLQASDRLGNTNIAIRGISSDTGSETTGIYIDDTPVQARQEVVGSNPYPKIFDLDRVEVLRGPQGTLFGAGSEGGTVRFLTPDPSLDTYSGYGRSELAFTDGGAPSYELGAAVGGPIVDGVLGFRASAWYREDGGYFTRVNPATGAVDGTDTNGGDTKVIRLAVKYAPVDHLTITPAIFYQDEHVDDHSFYFESAGPFVELSPIPQPRSDKFILPSLTVNYDFDAFSVKSISSFFKRSLNDKFDGTQYVLGSEGINSQTLPGDPSYRSTGIYHEDQSNWTEEIRFTSTESPDTTLSWVGGIFWQHNREGADTHYVDDFNALADYLSGGTENSLGYFGEAQIDGIYSYTDRWVERESDVAAFGNVTYTILDGLKASAGLRVARSGYDYIDQQDGPWGPGTPTTDSGSQKETPVTPRFNLAYQITPDQMVYATAAKGYRIGGANEPIPAAYCAKDLAGLGISQAPLSYNSDSVWSYEAGAKGRFLDNHLSVDASLFWVNWDNIQQDIPLTCGYGYTANLGTATSRGMDIQAAWAVGHGLTLSGNAGLTDARYSKTLLDNGVILAKAGDSLPSPEWTATASVQYDVPIRDETDGYIRLDYQFAGSYYRTGSAATFTYDAAVRDAPATHYVTLRVGAIQGDWDVSAFIDNLLNSRTSLFRYHEAGIDTGLRDSTYRPLTAGVTAAYKF